MALTLDERIPLQLLEITEPTRQQIRRAERGRAATCLACGAPLLPDDCCFAEGHDAHRSCAEGWNQALFDMLDQLED